MVKIYSIITLVSSILIGITLIIVGIAIHKQQPVSTSTSNDDDFPNDFDNDSNKIGGRFSHKFGIIIILIGVLNYYFVNKYKGLAAYEGCNVIIDFFRGVL